LDFLITVFQYLVVTLAFKKVIIGLVLAWKSGLKVPLLPSLALGPSCPLRTNGHYYLQRAVTPTKKKTADRTTYRKDAVLTNTGVNFMCMYCTLHNCRLGRPKNRNRSRLCIRNKLLPCFVERRRRQIKEQVKNISFLDVEIDSILYTPWLIQQL
jgi:hypothetical protein